MIDFATDEFLLRAVLAGIAVAVVAGPLGCFIVWRRMAYFGDTLAHSALLGVALGLVLGIDLGLGAVVVCVAIAALLVTLRTRGTWAGDTLLGILAHGGLSLGVVVLAFQDQVRVDLMAILFGDILAVSWGDLAWIGGGGGLALAVLVAIWRPLLSLTLHQDLARVEGVPVLAVEMAYMVLIALVIAVAMKIVGVLLVTSLLLIPAATARMYARTPESMAVLAALCGAVAVVGGLGGSMVYDTPSGPSVVVAALALFVLSAVVTLKRS